MFTDPVKNLKALGLKDDDIVADLGAGTGYYSVAAGHIVPRGKVYAVEISREFLSTIQNKIKDAHLKNVEIIWGNVEKIKGTKIADGIVDAAIVSNVLFQTDDKMRFVEEVKRILKPNGRVLFIDWSLETSVMGLKNIIPKEAALELFTKKGFSLQREIPAGAHHYGMILIKS